MNKQKDGIFKFVWRLSCTCKNFAETVAIIKLFGYDKYTKHLIDAIKIAREKLNKKEAEKEINRMFENMNNH